MWRFLYVFLVVVFKHILRKSSHVGQCHLVVGDSMTSIMAMLKGRSSARGLAPQLRLVTAHALASMRKSKASSVQTFEIKASHISRTRFKG